MIILALSIPCEEVVEHNIAKLTKRKLILQAIIVVEDEHKATPNSNLVSGPLPASFFGKAETIIACAHSSKVEPVVCTLWFTVY
jgi:hypothetical protein